MNPDQRSNVIVERSFAYALSVVNICRDLQADAVARVLARQLLRAGTSIGANVHEAQAAQSKAEFISKMYIAYKEARETAYWLRLVRDAELVKVSRLGDLADETAQLVKILSSILLTSKQNSKK